MSRVSLTGFGRFTLALVVAASVGCAGGNQDDAEDAAATSAAADPATDHTSMPGMDRPPAKDADQQFLRHMSDHHQGMVVLGTDAMAKGTGPV